MSTSKTLTVAEQLELQAFAIQALNDALAATVTALRNFGLFGIATVDKPARRALDAVNLIVGKQPAATIDGQGNFLLRAEVQEALNKWLSRGGRAADVAGFSVPTVTK